MLKVLREVFFSSGKQRSRERKRKREVERMAQQLGMLKVKVMKGINLAIADVSSSDPYVVLRMGKQKVKTNVIKKNTNPVWDEELTLSVEDPNLPLKVNVYDKDFLSKDDNLGNAEIDIRPLVEIVKKDHSNMANGTLIQKIIPNRENCLAEESGIYKAEGTIMQDLILRLKDAKCGEVKLRLAWVALPAKGA